jgi:UDP-N-acetylmuramoyl-tripeptide--D-alanyl-D-alanine ligase
MASTLKKAGVSRLFTLGEQTQLTVKAFGEYAQHFESHQLLLETLMPLLQGTETLLIKGSRAQRMEKITAALVETTGF